MRIHSLTINWPGTVPLGVSIAVEPSTYSLPATSAFHFTMVINSKRTWDKQIYSITLSIIWYCTSTCVEINRTNQAIHIYSFAVFHLHRHMFNCILAIYSHGCSQVWSRAAGLLLSRFSTNTCISTWQLVWCEDCHGWYHYQLPTEHWSQMRERFNNSISEVFCTIQPHLHHVCKWRMLSY